MQPSITACIGALVVALIYTMGSRNALCSRGMRDDQIFNANRATVWCLGAVLWPFVWSAFVGTDVLDRTPMAVLGLLWPPLLLSLDLIWITQSSEHSQSKQTLSYDGNAISSLAFALGGLLVTNVGQNFARAASPILTACVFLIVAFVLPTPGTKNGTLSGSIISAIQKVCLSYCVGLLLTAVGVNLNIGLFKYKSNQGEILLKALTQVAEEEKL